VAFVITQNCCKDASCVPVCPVDCIRPGSGADAFDDVQMLYIDPENCIDCGACMDECPVNAIYYEDELPTAQESFKDINAEYFARFPLEPLDPAPKRPKTVVGPEGLRVAIVGAGPAACYAATELVGVDGVQVDLFERLPTPYGLIRAGVAPDHKHTKSISKIFAPVLGSRNLRCHFNVEVGGQVTHEDLMAHHHAVVYAVGASHSRALDIPGADVPGSRSASEFVGWYNGHPDHAANEFDLSSRRVVIVGNGNVAIDAARILVSGGDRLTGTDIAQHALDALADSAVEEVVILGRRGLRHAAFSAAEFTALGHLDGVDVVVDNPGSLEPDADDDVDTALKLRIAADYLQRVTDPSNKRITLRFFASPAEILGDDGVTGVRIVDTNPDTGGAEEVIDTALVLRSIGYLGSAIDGVPFDVSTGTFPNDAGRVLDTEGRPVPGVYVTGWIKRGPRGVIGTNRPCAKETVANLLDDFTAGRLTREVADRDALDTLLDARGAQAGDWTDWEVIDAHERKLGAESGRPRIKLVTIDELLALRP
jgi:ferredoxin/flavodoxin---NADP+ reductase